MTAADGPEGVQKALELQPDLIILDLALPKLSGLEVCQRVRASPQLAHVPILVLTGKPFETINPNSKAKARTDTLEELGETTSDRASITGFSKPLLLKLGSVLSASRFKPTG